MHDVLAHVRRLDAQAPGLRRHVRHRRVDLRNESSRSLELRAARPACRCWRWPLRRSLGQGRRVPLRARGQNGTLRARQRRGRARGHRRPRLARRAHRPQLGLPRRIQIASQKPHQVGGLCRSARRQRRKRRVAQEREAARAKTACKRPLRRRRPHRRSQRRGRAPAGRPPTWLALPTWLARQLGPACSRAARDLATSAPIIRPIASHTRLRA
jgi:hypothetical protein